MSKVAIVTGGTRGIGKAISIALVKEGYKVVATYKSNDTVAEQFEKKYSISTYKYDASDYDECKINIETIKKKFGNIEVLINNCGIVKDCLFHKMDYNSWAKVINTNLTSSFNMSKCVIDDMILNKYGRIINISSVNALQGQFGQTNYSAAKAGIIGFTKSLAKETAKKGITVNVICPGYIKTDIFESISDDILEKIKSNIPLKRFGEPREVARVAIFLSDKESGYITGATFNINGGIHMQ